jgi:hypothetical protein
MNYVFPGLWPFIERVSRGRSLHHLGRAREVWHCKQVQDSLGQLPRLDLESQHELLGHVLKVRASLAVALEGIDAAILEVIGELNLPAPQGDHCGATPQAAFPAARQRRGYDIELNMISRKDTKTIPRRKEDMSTA